MLEPTGKRHTKRKKTVEARFIGAAEDISKLRAMAKEMGLIDATETVAIEEVFPELAQNPGGVYLRGIRYREEITQKQLADLTEIPRRHISEMESGKRPIGKDTAKKMAKVFNCDFRLFL